MPHRNRDGSTSPEARLGAELRKSRQEVGWSQERLAQKIQFSTAMVGFIERAERRPTQDFVLRCEAALGIAGRLQELWAECEQTTPRWFRPWTRIEAEARSIRMWEPLLVPGLLQTQDYARTVLGTEPAGSERKVEELLKARLHRQKILERDDPPVVSVLIDEGVLYRPVGGKEVMYQQLEHLLKLASRPRVTIQVIPVDIGATPGLLGGFAIAQVPGERDAAYMESCTNGQVTDRIDEVHAITLRYEAIHAWAYPQHVSKLIIQEMQVKYGPEG